MLRRSLIIGLVVALVATGCSQDSDPLAVATDLVDDWLTAWNTEDMDLLLSVFADDAVYIDPNGIYTGHDEIRAHAEERFGGVWDGQRLGDGTETETGELLFTSSFESAGGTNEGDLEVELTGDVIARFQWLGWELVSD